MDLEKYKLAKENYFTENFTDEFDCDYEEDLGWIPAEFIPDHDYWIRSSLENLVHKADDSIEITISMYDEHLETKKEHTMSFKVGDKLEIAAPVPMECPGYDYVPLLVEVHEIVNDAFALKVIGVDKEYEEDDELYYDEEDYEYEPFEFELGEDICFLPKEAVYSVQVSIEKITKTEDGCIMSIFVKDPDDEKDQTFEFPVKVGDIIEMDELVPGVVCFVGPDREPAKLEILEIADDYVSVRKVREE